MMTQSEPPGVTDDVQPGRILILDDDPAVARSLARLIRPHCATVAHNGADALKLLKSDSDWDAILCDVMMPVMSGLELYEALEQEHPELVERLIFVTGGAFTQNARELLRKVDSPTLEKPFVFREVHAVLNRLLNQRRCQKRPPRCP